MVEDDDRKIGLTNNRHYIAFFSKNTAEKEEESRKRSRERDIKEVRLAHHRRECRKLPAAAHQK